MRVETDYIIAGASHDAETWTSTLEDESHVATGVTLASVASLALAQATVNSIYIENLSNGDYRYHASLAADFEGFIKFVNAAATVTVWSPITGAIPASSSNVGPTVGELLTHLRNAGRNVGINDDDDTVYSLEEKHLTIQGILDHFIRETHCTTQADTIAIATDDESVDFSDIDGFHTDRLNKLWIDEEDVIEGPNLDEVLERRRCEPDATGSPTRIGFTDTQTARIWPTADDDYTLNVLWWPPLTAFTAGDTDSNDITINVPRDLAVTAVRTGGVAWLQNGSIENTPMTDRNRVQYEAHVNASRGRGGLGEKLAVRMSASELRRRRALQP